jgi:hypothetical protein
MKVLRQMIDYLRGRGLLTQDQLQELASQGILRWEEVHNEPPAPEEPSGASEDYDEDVEEPHERRPARGRRGGAGPRTPVVPPEELCRRLRERFGLWRPVLDRLTSLAPLSEGWEEAAVDVRNADLEHLVATLAARLHGLGLGQLWEALQLDGYREVLSGPELHGPTGAAYRALLSVPEPLGLGRYGALLRAPEVAAVVNLMQAQRRLLRACGELMRRERDLLAAALRRDSGSPAYWAFVLLYSARRGAHGRRPWPSAAEHPPLHAAPGDGDWPQLWSQAVAMDSRAVTPFLVERTRLEGERPQALGQAVGALISSLADGPRAVLYHYYALGWSLDRAAARSGWEQAGAAHLLETFRQDLRQALSANPATRVFLQPAAAGALEAFLADCLGSTWDRADYSFSCRREQHYADAIRAHFGPAFDLLCPRSWN